MGRLIVHWSPLHGQAKTTSSMSAIALAMNHTSGESVCITTTQYGMSDLEGMFDNRMSTEKKKLVYQASGLNALIANIKRDRLTREDVEGSTMLTPFKNVEMLPGIELNKSLIPVEEMDQLIYKILTGVVKECYDWVFVDLAAGQSSQSMKFIEAADIVVVTLSQNSATWERYFEQYEEIADKKNVFYLIGGHLADSKHNLKNFARMYQDYGVNIKKVGGVPENVGYMDAISDGTVPGFFMMNSKATKNDENGDFISECTSSAIKLRTFARSVSEESERD